MAEQEVVVLLHGLGRTPWAMSGLKRFLKRQQYQVINQGYSSRSEAIPELCRQLMHDLAPKLAQASKIHFVTHSLGGILLLYGLRHWNIPSQKIGRAVLLAPPSQGSEVVDILRWLPGVGRLMGPSFLQLGTDSKSIPVQLLERNKGGLPLEVGVIAGRKSYEPWFTPLFDGPNDGKVSVARSRLPGMKDYRVFDAGHTFIMNDRQVRRNILHFLNHGVFI